MIEKRILTLVLNEQNILNIEYIKKFSRQINYFSEFLENEYDALIAQKKIMESTILIFGCGAIGGNLAIQLAMAGVGKIILYDCDYIEESDIARHIFYRNEYLGMKKVEALSCELKKINKDIKIESICNSINPKSNIEDIILKSNFVINTMDEPYIGYTAAKISRICIKNNIVHFIAGGFDAHLASTGELIIPYITPCVECYASHFKITLKNWKPKLHPVKGREYEIGGLASMSLFSTSYACIEIIKYIAGLVDITKNFKIRGEFLFSDMNLSYLNVQKKENCLICGGSNET